MSLPAQPSPQGRRYPVDGGSRWRSRRMGILLCCGLGLIAIGGCSRVPQVVNDEAVFSELDALYTAVTSKRTNLLNDCRERLTKLHAEKRLSDAGFDEVTAVMEKCDAGDWTEAAQRLYNFMRAQRKTRED